MKHTWPLVVLLLCSTVALTALAQSTPEYVVMFSQVVHRNGVSSPEVAENQIAVCGAEYPCGTLVSQGMEQMVATGTYARARYNNESIVGANNLFFPSESYRPSTISSSAVALGRTLQSSAAFLSGVFPNANSFYPAIISTNATTDLVLSTDSLPPVMLKRYIDKEGLEAVLQPVVDDLFTWATLQAMADEASYVGCAQAARGQCAVELYNIGAYYDVMAAIADKPTLSASLRNLTTVQQAYYSYLFDYKPSNAEDMQQGSTGQHLAQQLIMNMRSFMQSVFTYKMFEYSTQSSVVTPLAVTLGVADADSSVMSPQYGESYFVELLQKTASSDSARFVRVVRGAANAAAFDELPFTLRCMDKAGTVYTAASNVCAFDDFVRYIDSTAPSVPNGFCVVNASQYAMLNCPGVASRRAVPIHSYCDIYRSMCPGRSCPDGYVLNAADLKCYPVAVGPTGVYDIRMAQVVHRHGARAPLVDFNVSDICGYEYPCGYLNGVGISMLQAVGAYVRSRYNDVNLVEAPFFPSERYNSSLVYTRSTGLERTLQSASSFLHALFPDSRNFFPVIYSVNMTTDFLINTDPMPPVMLKRWENDAGLMQILNPIVDEYFTWEELQAAAEDAFIAGTCVDYNYRWQCALDVHDVGTSFKATGKLMGKPALQAALAGVTAVNTQYFSYVFGYNATVDLDRTQGTMAQNIAQEMLGNIYAHLLAPTYKVFEYSTHDTLVAPLGVTLGDQSRITMDVPYAQTYIMELLQDLGDDSHHVRVMRGNPQDLTGDGNFTFLESDFVQHCISADGVVYEAAGQICPLEDFARFVHSTQPAIPKGYCNVSQVMYNNMGCPASIADGKPVSQHCQIYRIACGNLACQDGYILARDDLQCYPERIVEDSSSTEPVVVASPAIPVPVPEAKRFSEAQRKETAAGIVRGVVNGVIMGAAIAKHNHAG